MSERIPMRFAQVVRAEGVKLPKEFPAKSAVLVVPAHTRAVLLLDQGEETTGYLRLSFSGGHGAVIAAGYALSSMPYTPDESMAALRFFYYKLGDKLWSDYGFIDAFDLTTGWFDRGMHIAIDQGPIVVMIENYRTGLPWNLFMSDKDVQRGLAELGFTVEAGS